MSDFEDLLHGSITSQSDKHEVVTSPFPIPFQISENDVREKRDAWLRSLRFVPKTVKQQARSAMQLHQVYVPCWSFDAFVRTDYQIRRKKIQRNGTVHNQFNDLIVAGADALEVEAALEQAKALMQPTIKSTILDDVGDSKGQISHQNSSYSHMTTKCVLMPYWISTLTFGGKNYRFTLNDCTGTVQENTSRSPLKIAFPIAIFFASWILYILLRNGLR